MYGVSFVTDRPDSPHLKAKDIKGELYLAFAGHDPWVPDAQLKAVRKYYKAPHTIEVYQGTEHGYAFPLRPAYDQDAAEKSWKKVFALFERKLKGKAPARKR